jgi:hypothetical protein
VQNVYINNSDDGVCMKSGLEVQKTVFLEFSLCLSRACLGKMIVLYINGSKKPFSAGLWVQPRYGNAFCAMAFNYLIAKILPSFCQDRLGTSKHGRSRGTTRFCRDSIRGCARSGTKTVASFAMPFYDAKSAISLPRQARDKQT